MKCDAPKCRKQGKRVGGEPGAFCRPHRDVLASAIRIGIAEGTLRPELPAEEAQRTSLRPKFGERYFECSFADIILKAKPEEVRDMRSLTFREMCQFVWCWLRAKPRP
jgi:hypothetical protein